MVQQMLWKIVWCFLKKLMENYCMIHQLDFGVCNQNKI